jgi:hypothetical protein
MKIKKIRSFYKIYSINSLKEEDVIKVNSGISHPEVRSTS